MIKLRFNTLAATVIAGAGLAFLTLPASAATAAQSVTKQCSTQYNAAKEAGTLNGQKWPQFLSECSAKLKAQTGTDAAAPAATTPTKKATKDTTTTTKQTKATSTKPAKTETAAASGMSAKAVTKECSTQYQAAKSAGTLNGQTWPKFLSACSDSLKSDNSDATTPPEPAPTKATATKTTTKTATATTADGKPLTPGQIAFRQRISACGEQWQQAKAANKTGGKTWPQYWSACNTRMKSE
jgi:hypothetical protein